MIGRTHWLSFDLSKEIKLHYNFEYQYRYHNYSLMHWEKRTLISQFIIVRKSARRFVLLYLYHPDKVFGYTSAKNTRELADYIKNVYEWERNYTMGKEGIALPLGNRNINYLFYQNQSKENKKQ